MKIKCLERFNDRETGKRREAGSVYEYSEKRAEELIRSGYAEKAKDTDKIAEEPKKQKN